MFEVLGNAGITPDSTVVVVGTVDPTSASPNALTDVTRVAVTLLWAGVTDVTVLEGAYPKWVAEGGPATTVVPPVDAVEYSSEVNAQTFVSTEYVKEHIGKAIIIDAREEATYLEGHIPTARSLPALLIWQADGTYKSAEVLGEMAAGVIGQNKCEEIITYCGMGRNNSAWWYVLTQILGYKDVKFYDGSAQAWLKDNDMVR